MLVTNEQDRTVIVNLYNELIAPAFPANERMPETEFADYFLTDKYKDNHHLEHDGNDWVMAWCDFGAETDVKVIEFFVVAKDKRNNGLGHMVFQAWLERNDAPKLFMEIDSEAAFRFWKRFGLHRVEDLKYSQPALTENLKPVDTLIPAINFEAKPSEVAKIVRRYWYKYGFGIEVADE